MIHGDAQARELARLISTQEKRTGGEGGGGGGGGGG
jgi:hypothetical protein